MATFNENAAIRGALRRVFARSPIVKEVMDEGKRYVPHYNKDGSRSKKDRVEHHCQVCDKWYPAKNVEVDHIDPVISTDDGFVDWNTFVKRLFYCGKEKLQRICDWCHNAKTALERFTRIFKDERFCVCEIDKGVINPVESKQYLKKFTPKRMVKYPYPDNFKEQVARLRKLYGFRV